MGVLILPALRPLSVGMLENDMMLRVYRQCSSGLQAVADVAAAIKAGFYTIGIGAGVETMSKNPMAWEGGVNPRVAESKDAQNCLVPMGALVVHSCTESLHHERI